MSDWLSDNIINLVMDHVKDGLSLEKISKLLCILLIGACVKYHKKIWHTVQRFYRRVRQTEKIEALKAEMAELSERLSASISKLENNDKEFEAKAENIIQQMNELILERCKTVAQEKCKVAETNVEELHQIYDESLEDARSAFDLINSRLDLADRRAACRSERSRRIAEKVFNQPKESPLEQGARRD